MPTPADYLVDAFARRRVPAEDFAALFGMETEEAEAALCAAQERAASRRQPRYAAPPRN